VLHVLYPIFHEGYAGTAGPGLYRGEPAAEAIRLARTVRRLLPDDGEVAGLLAPATMSTHHPPVPRHRVSAASQSSRNGKALRPLKRWPLAKMSMSRRSSAPARA
jgi:predicted RNA polymerase sigma factor